MGHLFLLLLVLALLLLTVSAHASTTHGHGKAAFAEDNKSIAGIIGVIGSRPPSCAGRCRSCGHCEAVQVPISPQQLQKRKKKLSGHGSRAAAATAAVTGGRAMPASYYDHSNYKPLSWRCKCGRLILDP